MPSDAAVITHIIAGCRRQPSAYPLKLNFAELEQLCAIPSPQNGVAAFPCCIDGTHHVDHSIDRHRVARPAWGWVLVSLFSWFIVALFQFLSNNFNSFPFEDLELGERMRKVMRRKDWSVDEEAEATRRCEVEEER